MLEVADVERGVEETAWILSRFPGVNVFALTADKNPDWILRLIRAGATEYLTKPVVAAELVEAIKKLPGIPEEKRGNGAEWHNCLRLQSVGRNGNDDGRRQSCGHSSPLREKRWR